MFFPNFIEGGVSENDNDQMKDSLQQIQKIRDTIVCYMSSLLFHGKMMLVFLMFCSI